MNPPTDVTFVAKRNPAVDILSTRRALLRLFTTRPNEVVTHEDVCKALSRNVSGAAVHNAVTTLRRDMVIESRLGSGGGYVHLVPVPTIGLRRCVFCCYRDGEGLCEKTGQIVGPNMVCGGWKEAVDDE